MRSRSCFFHRANIGYAWGKTNFRRSNVRQCLVTGGAGFIGSHLVDALLAAGQRVRVLDDLSTGNLANIPADRVELIHGSVADPAIVDKAAAGCEIVYHLAAIASVTKSVESPVVSH